MPGNILPTDSEPPGSNGAAGTVAVGAGIRRQQRVCHILTLSGWTISRHTRGADAVAGWGRKPSGLRATEQAFRSGSYPLLLEDGFLRSVGLGSDGEPPLSLIMDPVGMYYDATRPSALENLLNDQSWVTPELLRRARNGRTLLRQLQLSKYNMASDPLPRELAASRYVLVIDQVPGDASLEYGLATADSFERMLDAARREHPDAGIVIKSHPANANGRSHGHFSKETTDAILVDGDINPWALIEGAEAVYTVTSGMGFEALLAGKGVRTFGMPYYAGWGLTADELACPRRVERPSLDMLFAAAYLLYPTYYDPLTDCLSDFETVAHLLAFWRDENGKNSQPTFCLSMSRWKRKTVSAFLQSARHKPVYVGSKSTAIAKAKASGGRVVVWASKSDYDLENRCALAGVPLLRMEDGFLRSRGLGSDLVQPSSLVLDATGIYYDPTRPSDLETRIERGAFSRDELKHAEALRRKIISNGLTKYNVGERYNIPQLPTGRKIILVPGQVADDASIRQGAGAINTNWKLLEITRQENPDAFIIYKPHPDVEAGNRHGFIAPHRILMLADYIGSDLSSDDAIHQSDEIWTITSLLGFEALVRGKKVTCFGLPFYAGWGLTDDRLSCSRRTRRASVTEILAAAYLEYAGYLVNGVRVPASCLLSSR
ncbi:MAG: capsular polysaccharide biosynthesis protein [Phyllobacterium sp.]